ncbi:hypothetical protein [Cellulomonas sp. NPDC089187]|uniref:DUF7832 domain-containing protein n=1 Tax=Cellulomonas sp. NPDC089187 TaxID=3154970 RepID=UPI0034356F3F
MTVTKYDDASWHYGGTYPDDLPDDAAATHIGMFLAWCLFSGFASDDAAQELSGELQELRDRLTTPGKFLIEAMDEKFISADLNEEGNAFTVAYYEGKDNDSRYVGDFLAAFGTSVADIYRVPDTWEVFERLAPMISQRYANWIAAGRPQFIV